VQLNWVAFDNGFLALGHRPGKKMRSQLEATGCSLVVNLLSHNESKSSIHDGRVRFPLQTAACPPPARDDELTIVLERIREELRAGGRVYVHCSAGLHRTGMIAYALFRWQGLARSEAVASIRQLRELTADELTEERMVLGDRIAGLAS